MVCYFQIDFGTMVVANKVVTREVYLMNHGSKPGSFKITYIGKKPLSITPASGEVPPKTAQVLRVSISKCYKMCCKE